MAAGELSLEQARRIVLAAQGFGASRRRKQVTHNDVAGVIRRLGLLQLDFVNVLTPSHYMVLFSRLGSYERGLLDEVVYQRRDFTEQWAHEASIVPMETWPLLASRRETHRVRPYGFETFLERHADYSAWVLDQLRLRGPLTAAELPEPEGVSRRIPGAWVGTVRAVLEAHFGRGLLAVASRLPSFARVYDLAERVIPKDLYGLAVSKEASERLLLLQAAQALGVAAAADLADYYRMPVRESRVRIAELVDDGQLHPVRVEGWRQDAYLHPKAPIGGRADCRALLSPFDPLIWYRPRALRLFNFEHCFEIFVPARKRRWGCYVLPFLMGDRLVARVDLKANREMRLLVVLAAHIESGADPKLVSESLAAELRALAQWLELDGVSVDCSGSFARQLKAARNTGSRRYTHN